MVEFHDHCREVLTPLCALFFMDGKERALANPKEQEAAIYFLISITCDGCAAALTDGLATPTVQCRSNQQREKWSVRKYPQPSPSVAKMILDLNVKNSIKPNYIITYVAPSTIFSRNSIGGSDLRIAQRSTTSASWCPKSLELLENQDTDAD